MGIACAEVVVSRVGMTVLPAAVADSALISWLSFSWSAHRALYEALCLVVTRDARACGAATGGDIYDYDI
jgi:hypothetical protein